MVSTKPLLETQDLAVNIGGKRVCRDLALAVYAGECWGVLGVNGVGKTTLLHTLAGLKPASDGAIRVEDRPLASMRRKEAARRIGLLAQTNEDPFPSSVLETALIGRHPYLRRLEWESASDEVAARNALAAVGLAGAEARLAHTLSGGERRLLALATLLTQDPPLYLLDEPSNHLDLRQQIAVLDLLKAKTRAGRSIVMVMHDVNLAARYCDRALLLYGDGESEQGGTAEILTEKTLSHLYRHRVELLQAGERRIFVPG